MVFGGGPARRRHILNENELLLNELNDSPCISLVHGALGGKADGGAGVNPRRQSVPEEEAARLFFRRRNPCCQLLPGLPSCVDS